MNIKNLYLNDSFLLEPEIYRDSRGCFYESYNQDKFRNLTNLDIEFLQDNHSYSKKGVLRGLHYQFNKPQGKLIRVIKGHILDVILDLRKKSSTFGKHIIVNLNEDNQSQLWAPIGFAHGYYVLSDYAIINYKVTEYYYPKDENCIKWNDPDLKINWGNINNLIISEKDNFGKRFKDSVYFD